MKFPYAFALVAVLSSASVAFADDSVKSGDVKTNLAELLTKTRLSPVEVKTNRAGAYRNKVQNLLGPAAAGPLFGRHTNYYQHCTTVLSGRYVASSFRLRVPGRAVRS